MLSLTCVYFFIMTPQIFNRAPCISFRKGNCWQSRMPLRYMVCEIQSCLFCVSGGQGRRSKVKVKSHQVKCHYIVIMHDGEMSGPI